MNVDPFNPIFGNRSGSNDKAPDDAKIFRGNSNSISSDDIASDKSQSSARSEIEIFGQILGRAVRHRVPRLVGSRLEHIDR